MEDSQIVDLYLQRDEAAVGHTAEKYGQRLRRLSLGIVDDVQTAEECEKAVPNPLGWWTPIENGAFFTGLYVYALMEKYENPIEHACDIKEGDVFIANGWERPEGFCLSAWESISPFVLTLSHGGGNFYDGWMKNEKSAMISCNDGFRPVSFYIEVIE